MSKGERIRRCHVCGGRMLPTASTHLAQRDGAVFVFEHVPATVCEDCGETAFRGPVLDAIDRLIDQRPAPARTVEAAVYDLAAVPVGGGD
jgi:YgiT-type zinc finger domain-containing protein